MSDNEMYKKIEFLQTEDETLGCYIKGHYDNEQFARVADKFLREECMMRNDEKFEVKVGYYKVVPYRDESSMCCFNETKMRGAFPVMEAKFC
jgi:hypothetical protein